MSQKPISSQSVMDEEEMLSLEQTPYDKVVEQRNKQLSQDFEEVHVFTLSHQQVVDPPPPAPHPPPLGST